ncbi:MAG: sensor histidine kinase [Spirochaetaceae bacterium]
MRSLFVHTFLAMVASLLVMILVAALFFYVGVRRSVAEWNLYRNQRIQNLIVPIVSRSYRQHAALERGSLERALLPFVAQNQYVYVFDSSGSAVFLYRNGEILETTDVSVTQSGDYNGVDATRPPSALLHSDEIVGFLTAGTMGFTTDPANRQFLVSMTGTLGAMLFVAFGLASLVAGLLSRGITRQTAALASGIGELASGRRDVRFPDSNAEEIRIISGSAQRLQTQLQREETLRRQWAQDIAHDLRTPVTAIKTQFEAMIEGVIEPGTDRLKQVFAEVERIDGLVNDLRELNSLETPEQTIDTDVIQVTDFVRTLELRFESLFRDSELSYKSAVDDFEFIGDDRLLTRTLSNVIHNAATYAERPGTVELSARRTRREVVFDVRNSGSVDDATADHAFDRLYRGENSRGSRGSGLGLSIARAVVDLHRGTIRMTQENAHTVVRIVLPQDK